MKGRYYYTLDSLGRPVRTDDLFKWAHWFEEHREDRIVKQEYIGEHYVSTVFLGLDYGWMGEPPILWETMVFSKTNKKIDGWADRCSGNKEQAEAMHERMVKKVKGQICWK